MINTTLFRRSTFFIDVMNVLLHIDLFIYNELIYRMKRSDTLKELFYDKIPKVNTDKVEERDIMVIMACSSKLNQNILMDWVNIDKFNELSDEDLESFLAMLYFDILTNPNCGEYIQMTEFGNTMKILLSDSNLDSMVMYLPFKSDFVINSILESFASIGTSKISIVCGDKESYFATRNNFDSYIFENVSDVDNYLLDKTTKNIEVLIPSYEYNLVIDRTDLEKLVEQVTYQRLNIKESPEVYRNKKISINTISVPI